MFGWLRNINAYNALESQYAATVLRCENLERRVQGLLEAANESEKQRRAYKNASIKNEAELLGLRPLKAAVLLQENEIAALRARLNGLEYPMGLPIHLAGKAPTDFGGHSPTDWDLGKVADQLNPAASPSDLASRPLLGLSGPVEVTVFAEKPVKQARKGKGRTNKKATA